MEESQRQDGKVPWTQDQTQKQNQAQATSCQDQAQPPHGSNQLRILEEETQQVHRPSPLKKKAQTAAECRRNQGPTARAAASHLNSAGLRKAQSVHSLLTDTGNTQLTTQTGKQTVDPSSCTHRTPEYEHSPGHKEAKLKLAG